MFDTLPEEMAREHRLRRAADRQGLKLRKSRTRNHEVDRSVSSNE
jgi:hypothetical protein